MLQSISGLAISDYRSFGKVQRIYQFGKLNVFAGSNNAGKSNVLRFINENLKPLMHSIGQNGPKSALNSVPHNRRGSPSKGLIGISASVEDFQKVLKPTHNPSMSLVNELHAKLIDDGLLWIGESFPGDDILKSAENWSNNHAWYELWCSTSNATAGDLRLHWIPGVFHQLKLLVSPPPKVFAIPVDRQATASASGEEPSKTFTVLGGAGVIVSLAEMENPKHVQREEFRKRFMAVQNFVRVVTDDGSAEISVPHTQDQILVKLKEQPYLPLASLGSGIEQVILHAVAATSATDAIVTFEEPELHLHPVLQRQLLTYLATTSNQYFISTHSAHLIDALHAHTFHVRLHGTETQIEKASSDAKRHKVCEELGYRPSDIVQANCVIWVEGPSDRIYVRGWLKKADPNLKEHVHYSIMFYGGKLLSHLTARESEDEALDNLIQLRLLNRNLAVVIDSDLTKADGEIRPTKARVRDEIRGHGGFVWITAGREIENYVPVQALAAAVESVHQGLGNAVKSGRYKKAFPTVAKGANCSVNKVAVAQRIEESDIGLDVLDLCSQIKELSRFIRKANGLAAQ